MNRTGIEWCDWTWNPIVGCSPASNGCANCYAAAISKRFHLPWGTAHFMPDRITQPAKVRTPGRVFVCSMSDLGHETVRAGWLEQVCMGMQWASWHTYIVLTKRPGEWLRQLPRTCWVGVTIEHPATAWRWNRLLGWGWPGSPVKFVSAEPLLEGMTFGWLPPNCRPDWVIAGPETGPKARRCDDAWIDALAAESPCFFDKRKTWHRREFPVPNAGTEARGNRVASGALLGLSGSEDK